MYYIYLDYLLFITLYYHSLFFTALSWFLWCLKEDYIRGYTMLPKEWWILKAFCKKVLMFSLIINTMFVLIKSLRKINSCLNWKVEIPIHLVWFTIVHVLVKSHELARLSETFKLDDKNIIHWKIQTLQSTWKIFQLIIYLESSSLNFTKKTYWTKHESINNSTQATII